MSDSSRKKNIFLIGLVLMIVSVISIHVAMIFYPGGTFVDSGTVGYSFWENMFSDLGMIISHSGAANPIGFVLFTISIIIGGVVFIAIFSILPSMYTDSKKAKWASILGSAFGILMGILYILLAFAPEDINYDLHQLIAQYLYMATMLTFAIYALATLWNKDFSIKYTLSYLSIALAVFICLGLFVVVRPDPLTLEGLLFYGVGQKIIHYTLWTGFILVVYGIWKKID